MSLSCVNRPVEEEHTTGLFIPFVKHAVRFHGDNISVANQAEGGLRFVFSLKKK